MPSNQERGLIRATEVLPPGFNGSRLEYLVVLILDAQGYRQSNDLRSRNQNEYVRQVSVAGGRGVRGGLVVDFVFPAKRAAWFVQGFHYHRSTPERRARTVYAINIMRGRGYRVVELNESQLLDEPYAQVKKALAGV